MIHMDQQWPYALYKQRGMIEKEGSILTDVGIKTLTTHELMATKQALQQGRQAWSTMAHDPEETVRRRGMEEHGSTD